MKKTLEVLILFTIVLFVVELNGQCPMGTAVTTLDINNISAAIPQSGTLFWDGSSDAGYVLSEASSTLGLSTLFAGGLWIGGYDSDGNLKLAVSEYGFGYGRADFWPGPIDENGNVTSSSCENWDRHWETGQGDIDLFLADWSDGTLDDPIPTSILEWPGRKNPKFMDLFGFDFPNVEHDFAPFVDVNNDGIYDPEDGDYPAIKEASQAIYWVFNDAGNTHTESGGAEIKVEIHGLAYAYSSNSQAINNTTYYDFNVINKSPETLYDTFIALWLDPALGCYTDDYFGSDPDNQMVYFYNQDSLDGQIQCNCLFDIPTFCDEIPMLGVKMLKGASAPKSFGPNGELQDPSPGEVGDTIINLGLSKVIYYAITGALPPPFWPLSPTIDYQYYNYLSGRFIEGNPITYGGKGVNQNSTDYVDFVFSDEPNDPNGWSMCSEDPSFGETRILMSTGPFQMSSGAINSISFAVIHVPDVPHPCPSLEPLREACVIVEDLYNGEISTTKEILDKSLNISLKPNPFSNETQLIFPDLTNQVETVQMYNLSGQLVREYKNITGDSLRIIKKDLHSGIYFWKVQTRDHRFQSGKVIIQ